MGELRQLLIAVTVAIIIGVGGLFFVFSVNSSDSISIPNYNAILTIHNRQLILNENYTYNINDVGEYHMLYRDWEVPLLVNTSFGKSRSLNTSRPYILVTRLSSSYSKAIPYAIDVSGEIFTPAKDTETRRLIKNDALKNEVGFYEQEGYLSGKYEVGYQFHIYPPIQYDKVSNINLKLASKHMPYNSVNIKVIDKGKDIIKLYVHPTSLKVIKNNKGYEIKGKSEEDGLIELDMIVKNNSIDGYYKFSRDIKNKVINTNRRYIMISNLYKGMADILIISLILFPLFLLWLYFKYGTEKEFVVPKDLSYVPNKERKPWLVNYMFNGREGEFNKDGFYATILDLQKRGYLKIIPENKNKPKNVLIQILKKDSDDLDEYEKKVMNFITKYSKDDVFDPKELKKELRQVFNSERKYSIRKDLISVIQKAASMPNFKKYFKELINNKGNIILNIITFTSIIIFVILMLTTHNDTRIKYPYSSHILILSFIFVFQTVLTRSLSPAGLFGRWKDDNYREKLQWDSFKRFLSHFAMIQKYSSEDLSMWKDWLVYGTALGVGKKVSKALSELNIPLNEDDRYYLSTYSLLYLSFDPVIAAANPSENSDGSVVGGGFGGGGAGAR